jgi:copper chaperone
MMSLLTGRKLRPEGERIMTTIKIKGMSCNHCVMAVTKALNEIHGIKDVKVDLSKGEATFEEDRPADMNVVREQIKKSGYEVV